MHTQMNFLIWSDISDNLKSDLPKWSLAHSKLFLLQLKTQNPHTGLLILLSLLPLSESPFSIGLNAKRLKYGIFPVKTSLLECYKPYVNPFFLLNQMSLTTLTVNLLLNLDTLKCIFIPKIQVLWCMRTYTPTSTSHKDACSWLSCYGDRQACYGT